MELDEKMADERQKKSAKWYKRALNGAIFLQMIHIPLVILLLSMFFPTPVVLFRQIGLLYQFVLMFWLVLGIYGVLLYIFGHIYLCIVIAEFFLLLFFLFRTGDWKAAIKMEKKKK